MISKPFYNQLKTSKKVSVCGLSSSPEVTHDENGMPLFEPGYTIRVTGDVEEVEYEYVQEKARSNKDFLMGLKDIHKYPATRVFRLKRGRGEVFDFDFEHVSRDHKLLRTKFTFNGFEYPFRGVIINDNCTNCGMCVKACSFKAIYEGDNHYMVDNNKCDVCGDCGIVCKFEAIEYHKQ